MKWLDKKILDISASEAQEKRIKDLECKVSESKKEVILLTLALRKSEAQVDDLWKGQKNLNTSFLNDTKQLATQIEENKKTANEYIDSTVHSLVGSVKTMTDELSRIESKEDQGLINLHARVNAVEEIHARLDDGIILMTKAKLLQLIDQKIEVFEGNINNKMSGLMIYVNDKAQAVQSGRLQDVELLKKLARLEGENGS